MNSILQISLIIGTILFCLFILCVTRKKGLSYKYTLLWLFLGLITLVIAVFPQVIKFVANFLHIVELTNALFLVYMFLIIVIIFYISMGFSGVTEKVTKLIQENAILAAKVEKLEKKIEDKKNENN